MNETTRSKHPLSGVIAATLTPLGPDLRIDVDKACAYYEWLLENGCNGLNVLGTTGEAMSFPVAERAALMRGLASRGLPVHRMMAGTGACALADAVHLTQVAVECGFGGVLLMPPFFFEDISDDGVLAFYDALARGARLRPSQAYLYNFPKLTGITFTPRLVGRLLDVIPIAGIKDSSNDLPYCRELHYAFADLAIFPSSEEYLRDSKASGLAGCISGTVALWPHFAGALWNRAQEPQTEPLQVEIASMRAEVVAHPLVPAVRYLTALQQKDATWEKPVPPLEPLDEAARRALQSLASV
ncbi:MAG: dihydrodipicolinate synthase family protein [Candidatus Eremiobacteraeota bacterium]|nr:dihydrodipicolinate synthase family protein [Candidatus Eremiobacteraeota bacterium]